MYTIHFKGQSYLATLHCNPVINVPTPAGTVRQMAGASQARDQIGYQVDVVIALRFLGQDIEVEDDLGGLRIMSVESVQYGILWCRPVGAGA